MQVQKKINGIICFLSFPLSPLFFICNKFRDVNTLFRSQSLASKVLYEMMKFVGNKYLIASLKPLIDLVGWFAAHFCLFVFPTSPIRHKSPAQKYPAFLLHQFAPNNYPLLFLNLFSILQIYAERKSCEIDPSKLKPGESLERNFVSGMLS